MMYMVIHCGYCGQDWQVYRRDDLYGVHARTCPHCGTKVDKSVWEEKVLFAMALAFDANQALYKDHVENHNAVFTVAYIPDHIFPDRLVSDVLRECDIQQNID